MNNRYTISKEQVRELLKKYFEAEATLEEEELLRSYFAKGDIDEEFEPYAPMFCLFAEEREELLNDKGIEESADNDTSNVNGVIADRNIAGKRRFRRRYFRLSAIVAAAALIVAAILIDLAEKDSPVLIVNGVKIDDPELAIAMVEERLSSMNMAMERIHDNGAQLEKMGKLNEIISSFGLSQK